MALSFRAASSVANGTASTTLILVCPAGVVNGDLMIAAVGNLSNTTSITCAAPAGWTQVTNANATSGATASDVRHSDWIRIASGEVAGTTTYTFTFGAPTSTTNAGGIAAYIGGDTTTPEDVAAVMASSSLATVTDAGVTTVTDNAFVICAGTISSNTATTDLAVTTPASGVFQRFNVAGRRTTLSDFVKTPAGATGNVVFTESGTANVNKVSVFGIRPASVAAPAPLEYVLAPLYRN